MNASAVRRFSSLPRREGLPDLHTLSGDRERILWVLSVCKDDEELGYLSPATIADILTDGEGIHISRQRVTSILKSEKGTVARKRTRGRFQYKLMRAGEDELYGPTARVVTLIDPERAFSEIRKFESILETLKGDVKICDPYVENKTIDFISCLKEAKSIRILTVNILNERTFRRDLTAYRAEHAKNLDVKVSPDAKLHDRYIIHNDGMLLLGTSLNGIGKKQSFVTNAGNDIKSAIEVVFERLWNSAQAFK